MKLFCSFFCASPVAIFIIIIIIIIIIFTFILFFVFLLQRFFWYLFFFFHLEHSFFPQPPISYWQKFPTQKNFLKQYTYADFFAISQKEHPNSIVFCFVSKHKKANLLPIIDLTPHK